MRYGMWGSGAYVAGGDVEDFEVKVGCTGGMSSLHSPLFYFSTYLAAFALSRNELSYTTTPDYSIMRPIMSMRASATILKDYDPCYLGRIITALAINFCDFRIVPDVTIWRHLNPSRYI